MLLGVLAGLLEVPAAAWEELIEEYVPAKALEVNKRAFKAGGELLLVSGGARR